MASTVTIVPMPQMGVSVTEGSVVEWHKAVGDVIAEGDVLCDIVTDKVDTEVTAPADGVLIRVIAEAGETVPVGEPLAELAPPGTTVGGDETSPQSAEPAVVAQDPAARAPEVSEVASEPPAAAGPDESPAGEATPGVERAIDRPRTPASAEPSRFSPEAAAEALVANGAGTPLSSPLARRLAAEHGIDLTAVQGSGRRGRIRRTDVIAAVEARRAPSWPRAAAGAPAGPAQGAPATQTVPPGPPLSAAPPPPASAADGLPRGYEGVPHEIVATSPQRRAIAEHMVRSRHSAAHMTTEVEVDMHRVARVRAELNADRLASRAPKLSYLPFIARATCAALREFPDLNATFETERLIRWRDVNLGIAVDTERGLLVPVIRGCDRLNVMGIGDAIAEIAARARSRKLTPDDMAAGTFTISNPGSVGATSAMAIINQPQVAILGTPAIVKRPWVVSGPDGEDLIVPRPIMQLAVTFDHRAVDGADATRFAVRIKQHLESWDAAAYA